MTIFMLFFLFGRLHSYETFHGLFRPVAVSEQIFSSHLTYKAYYFVEWIAKWLDIHVGRLRFVYFMNECLLDKQTEVSERDDGNDGKVRGNKLWFSST